jgi:hypothetical protein
MQSGVIFFNTDQDFLFCRCINALENSIANSEIEHKNGVIRVDYWDFNWGGDWSVFGYFSAVLFEVP